MKINKMFFLPATILIAGFNCIYGKNPNTDHSNPAPDAIETMFQKIKDNVSDIKTKTYRILKFISDSDLKKSFFKTSLTNYTQINLNNNHNNNHINDSIDTPLNDEYIEELTDIVKKLYQENLKQRTEFNTYHQEFLNHGIQTDQTDRDIFMNGGVLMQLANDCTNCTNHQKYLSKKHHDKNTGTEG